jgi:hypothetical protein
LRIAAHSYFGNRDNGISAQIESAFNDGSAPAVSIKRWILDFLGIEQRPQQVVLHSLARNLDKTLQQSVGPGRTVVLHLLESRESLGA